MLTLSVITKPSVTSAGLLINDYIMPVKNAVLKETTLTAYNQLSYESIVAAWLLGDGWEVLVPAIYNDLTQVLLSIKFHPDKGSDGEKNDNVEWPQG